jgi:mercuric ion transport protein
VGPLVLALLGLGGAGVLVKFEPYRPLFVILTLALLGVGFHSAYRRAGARIGANGESCACELPRASMAGRAALWIVSVGVAVLLAAPYLIPFFVR